MNWKWEQFSFLLRYQCPVEKKILQSAQASAENENSQRGVENWEAGEDALFSGGDTATFKLIA